MGLLRGLLRGVQKDQARVVIEDPKDRLNPIEVAQSIGAQVLMLRQILKELPDFRLYQKEQIPLFGRESSSAGSY